MKGFLRVAAAVLGLLCAQPAEAADPTASLTNVTWAYNSQDQSLYIHVTGTVTNPSGYSFLYAESNGYTVWPAGADTDEGDLSFGDESGVSVTLDSWIVIPNASEGVWNVGFQVFFTGNGYTEEEPGVTDVYTEVLITLPR